MKKIETSIPEYNEGYPVFYIEHDDVETRNATCRHLYEDGGKWILPRAIWARNEGDSNSTLICLDCLLEWVEGLHEG